MMTKSELDEEKGILEVSQDGRFIRYDEVLDKGTFKIVYKGFDKIYGTDLKKKIYGTEVAWYQISIDEGASDLSKPRQKILSESDLMKSLNHDNVIKCHSSWIDDVNMNINMIAELCSSGTLRQYRKKHKSFDIMAIKNWGEQILEGLQYLYSQDPPIIHTNLKCDSIFANGNRGEVKIADLGMVTMRHYGTARIALGTPEYMAPELYDDEYNELVDIYSFGMCLLELVTCEKPYGECKKLPQIFKKATAGEKPRSLEKIEDPQIREIIEKCLQPASQRLSATELLKDPFFSSASLKEVVCEPLMPNSTNLPKSDSQVSISIGSCPNMLSHQSSFASINEKATPVTTLESWKSTEQIQLRLRGNRIDSRTILFNFRIQTDFQSHVANCFEFTFDLEGDDALKIAIELVQEEDLPYKNVPLVVELIDSMLLELEPVWKPCCGYYKETIAASGSSYHELSGQTSDEKNSRGRLLRILIWKLWSFNQAGNVATDIAAKVLMLPLDLVLTSL